MSAVKAPTGEAQKQAADTVPQDSSQHWSLAASAWPGADMPVSYVARAWRTRARLQVWPAWQEDWTTDPTYRIDGVRLYRFDREGFPIPPGSFRSWFLDLVLQTLCLVQGRRVCREPDLHYPSWQGEDLGLLTQGANPASWSCRIWRSCLRRGRWPRRGSVRCRSASSVWMGTTPHRELVVEVVSPSTEAKDFEDNLSLHAAMGIPEDLLVDTGEFKTEPHMWLFRRAETDGACHVAESGLALTACGAPMRLRPAAVPGNVPVFQCQDPETRHWHDYEGSIERRGEVHTVLPSLPSTDRARIEASWQEAGLPADAVQRILSLQGEPERWPELLETPFAPEAANASEPQPNIHPREPLWDTAATSATEPKTVRKPHRHVIMAAAAKQGQPAIPPRKALRGDWGQRRGPKMRAPDGGCHGLSLDKGTCPRTDDAEDGLVSNSTGLKQRLRFDRPLRDARIQCRMGVHCQHRARKPVLPSL